MVGVVAIDEADGLMAENLFVEVAVKALKTSIWCTGQT